MFFDLLFSFGSFFVNFYYLGNNYCFINIYFFDFYVGIGFWVYLFLRLNLFFFFVKMFVIYFIFCFFVMAFEVFDFRVGLRAKY